MKKHERNGITFTPVRSNRNEIVPPNWYNAENSESRASSLLHGPWRFLKESKYKSSIFALKFCFYFLILNIF